MLYCYSLTTKYHGPTDTRGARISASITYQGRHRRIYCRIDYALTPSQMHTQAAHDLLTEVADGGEFVLVSCADTGTGYNFHVTIG